MFEKIRLSWWPKVGLEFKNFIQRKPFLKLITCVNVEKFVFRIVERYDDSGLDLFIVVSSKKYYKFLPEPNNGGTSNKRGDMEVRIFLI